jgi:phospholipid/cholesterol/gamma-HCH transport system ATP-binding protein
MIGLLPRRGGEIALPVAAGSQARRRGVLFQQGALFSALNARQNIQFPLREAAHLSGTLLDEIANAKLEMVGLTPEDGDKLPSELSGGMTKRVALARALALDPALLFLDEPTPGLDPIAAGEFDTLIKALQETLWFTVFMITHDLNTLAAVCDRVAAFADGKIVALGPLSSVLASDHPWVKAYFHGARAQMLHLEASLAKDNRSWKPALPTSSLAPWYCRRSPLCSVSSTGLTMPAASASVTPIMLSSMARCRASWSGRASCSTAFASARSPRSISSPNAPMMSTQRSQLPSIHRCVPTPGSASTFRD